MPRSAILVLLVACGSSTSSHEPQPPADRGKACGQGDMAACVEQAAAACTDKAWQLEVDQPTPLYVAPSGVARLDRLGMELLGTNGEQWLACVEQCPGTTATKVCIPFAFDLTVDYQAEGECERSAHDLQPWNGQPARSVVLDCPGAFAEVAYVPALRPVQQALVAAHVIDASGALDVPGLLVNLNVAGEPLFRIHRATDASCDVFAIPAGYRVIRGADAFARASKMQPELEATFARAKQELEREADAAVDAARREAMKDVASLCKSQGFADTADGLGDCTFKVDEARALITKAVGAALARYARDVDPKVDAALAEHVLTPLCKEFAQ
ncbi:MAG TPA: hypothetical protein VL172_03675 [Kofleriaceae bacterium]|jgi:hypothetical protein|nr:hypothetical protein [Kofleriaceae bacterium]